MVQVTTQGGNLAARRVDRCAVVVLAACALAGCGAGQSAWFAEEADARGLRYSHRSGYAGRPMLPEITGGGAALADLDGDGDLDAYLVQSGSLHDAVERDASYPANSLFLNDGAGRFEEAPSGNGADDRGYGMGVAAGDYDNDGDVDLYVTNVGANALLRNDGAARFENVAATAGVADAGWGTSASFHDFDHDGDLDLFIVNYINWSPEVEINCYLGSLRTYCPPSNYQSPAKDRLFRNNGDGTFTDVSEESGIGRAFGNGFGVVGADFDGNGSTDLFIANDMMPDLLWLNRGEMRFEEVGGYWGCAVDEHGFPKAGMGVAAADVDDDGDMDVMVTNLEAQTDSFFRNEGGYFHDATGELGLGLTGRYTRWGVVLEDFDNDGALDLYEANGMVGTEARVSGLVFDEPNMLFRGVAGRFEVVLPQGGVAPALVHTSRGVAVGDVDDDGGLDLLVANRDGPAYLLMNRVRGRGSWARFRVLAGDPPRDAHGATVSATVGARRVHRDVQPEGSYLASSDPRVHFGLGEETRVRAVAVRWPGESEPETFGDFDAEHTHTLRRGAGSRSGK